MERTIKFEIEMTKKQAELLMDALQSYNDDGPSSAPYPSREYDEARALFCNTVAEQLSKKEVTITLCSRDFRSDASLAWLASYLHVASGSSFEDILNAAAAQGLLEWNNEANELNPFGEIYTITIKATEVCNL